MYTILNDLTNLDLLQPLICTPPLTLILWGSVRESQGWNLTICTRIQTPRISKKPILQVFTGQNVVYLLKTKAIGKVKMLLVNIGKSSNTIMTFMDITNFAGEIFQYNLKRLVDGRVKKCLKLKLEWIISFLTWRQTEIT